MPERTRWRATSAWNGLLPPDFADDAGLHIELCDAAALTTIIVRRGCDAKLGRLLFEHIGCALPSAGGAEAGATHSLIWSAPGQWLAVSTDAQAFLGLSDVLADVAAVTDQSDSRALVRLSGARARDRLAQGFAIDLHPSAYRTGCTAVTKVAHLSVQIWQIDETPTYMIAVPRSLASTFLSWLNGAAAH